MADYTSFTPWKKQIEDLKPSVRSKRYKVTPSGRNVRLINAQGRDEGMVAFINDRGTLGGGESLLDKLKPILNGPTDEERETESTATAYPADMPEPIAATTLNPGSGSLKAFARSGAGGLRNEQNEEAAITELQEFLASLGQDTGGIDGKYGPKTNAAVLKFQNAVGLKTDGDAGPNTIAKIIDIQNDLKEIERLLQKLKESITDISKFGYYKSTLMNTLLEAELSTAELDRLKQLQSKYEPFVQEFPEFKTDIFQKVNTAIQTNGQSGLSNDEITNIANDAIDSAEEPTAQEPASQEPAASSNDTDLDTLFPEPAAQEPAAQEPAAQEPAQPSSSNTTYNARTPVEDLKLPLEGGQSQQKATEQYNNLIDQENFEEAANALRDNEALGVPPQGLEAELRRRAAAESPKTITQQFEWEKATRPNAMIDGYSLWSLRKDDGTLRFTYTVDGEEPGENAEEYRRPAEAIAAAGKDRNSKKQSQNNSVPTQTSGYQFAKNSQGQFYARVNEWPFELPSSHRSIATAQKKDVRIIQVAGGQWAATVWNGQSISVPILFTSWQPRFRNAWMSWLSANGIDPRTGQPKS